MLVCVVFVGRMSTWGKRFCNLMRICLIWLRAALLENSQDNQSSVALIGTHVSLSVRGPLKIRPNLMKIIGGEDNWG